MEPASPPWNQIPQDAGPKSAMVEYLFGNKS